MDTVFQQYSAINIVFCNGLVERQFLLHSSNIQVPLCSHKNYKNSIQNQSQIHQGLKGAIVHKLGLFQMGKLIH